MVAESANPQRSSPASPRTSIRRPSTVVTHEETFLDDIRVSLQEIKDGHVMDSKQRIREMRAQMNDAKDDC